MYPPDSAYSTSPINGFSCRITPVIVNNTAQVSINYNVLYAPAIFYNSTHAECLFPSPPVCMID